MNVLTGTVTVTSMFHRPLDHVATVMVPNLIYTNCMFNVIWNQASCIMMYTVPH